VFASVVMFGAVVGLEATLPGNLAWTLVVVGVGAAVYSVTLLAVSTRVREKARSFAPL
jgi:uncharacterized membrane protein YhiD involved in acid resistance